MRLAIMWPAWAGAVRGGKVTVTVFAPRAVRATACYVALPPDGSCAAEPYGLGRPVTPAGAADVAARARGGVACASPVKREVAGAPG